MKRLSVARRHINWTTNFAASATVAWCAALGLVEQTPDQSLALTDYGAVWEKRLPEVLPVPEPTVSTGTDGGGGPGAYRADDIGTRGRGYTFLFSTFCRHGNPVC